MRFSKRWFGYGAAVVAVAGLVWWLWRPAVIPVTLAPVTSGPVAVIIEEEGETRVRERFLVAAPVSGRLERIEVRVGDRVLTGAVIARMTPAAIDPRTRRELAARLEAALDGERTALADVARTTAAMDQAARERTRIERLFQQNVISTESRERAILAETVSRQEHVAADHRARAAAHEVEQARAALSSVDGGGGSAAILRAPVTGRILSLSEQSERVIQAGTPVVEIGDPADLEVVVALLTTDAVKVQTGDTIALTGWGGPDSLVARVVRIEPSAFTKVSALGVEEQRVRVIAEICGAPPALGDRFRLEAGIVIARRDGVVRVPRSALFRLENRWTVFVESDGRAAEREVQLGLMGRDHAEVVSGLAVGEQVILRPDERIASGVRIRSRSE